MRRNWGCPPLAQISIDETWSGVRFKYAPGLEQQRAQRTIEVICDADGTPCIDKKTRVITPPHDLQARLAKDSRANTFFNSLSFTHRKEYVAWIIEAKRPETRAQRVSQAIEKLRNDKKNPSEK